MVLSGRNWLVWTKSFVRTELCEWRNLALHSDNFVVRFAKFMDLCVIATGVRYIVSRYNYPPLFIWIPQAIRTVDKEICARYPQRRILYATQLQTFDVNRDGRLE